MADRGVEAVELEAALVVGVAVAVVRADVRRLRDRR